jgi:PKD repeat protein
MNNSVPARSPRAQQATGPGGRAPGVRTPEAGSTATPSTLPIFEPLEDRRLLASVSLSNGVLQLVGDSSRANEMVVQRSGSSNLYAYVNNVNKKVALSSVKSVKFTGGSKTDDIFLASDLKLNAEARGGAGNDTIRLGLGNDYADGGDGNDRIWTREGNDKAYGGSGDDEIAADLGDDYVDGGAGDDDLDGGGGNDVVLGGADDDSLVGNVGNDKLDGGDGNDSLRADAGNDSLYGGAGNDSLRGGTGVDYFDDRSGKNVFEDIRSEDKVPYGSSYGTPGGGNGNSDDDGSVPVGITDNDATIVGKAVDSQTPRPVINLIGKTGTGPHTVHVHALATTLNGGNYLTARWQWDFGDPDGKYNYLEGWNAAHVYDKPGTYTIKLTVTNENGRSASLTTQVRVVADTRRTIYVDAQNGDDGNTGATEKTAVRTAERVKDLLGSHTRVLFKRDQRHVFDFSLSVPFQDVYIGAYGSGDRPLIWRVKGVGSSAISMYPQSNQITIEDLAFDSPNAVKSTAAAPTINADAVYARGVNITVRDCEFLNLDDAVNANGDPRGLLVQDNTAPLATGIRNYFIWSEGSDHVFLGNSAANSTREHNLRSSGTTRMLVAFNDFTNLDRSKVDEPDYSKGTVEVHKGSFAYVWRNELHDGALRAGPRGSNWESPGLITQWVVFDGNELYEHDLTVKVGTHHFMARNNIIRTNTSAAITIQTSDDYGRTVSDISFINNTGITSQGNGRFLNVAETGGNKGAITLKNNLWLVPKFVAGTSSAPVYVAGKNLDVFKEISNNVWPKPVSYNKYGQGGIFYVWPKWSDSDGFKDMKEWDAYSQVWAEELENPSYNSFLMPAKGTTAATAGESVKGVFTDIYGRTRSLSGKVTAGAVQTV